MKTTPIPKLTAAQRLYYVDGVGFRWGTFCPIACRSLPEAERTAALCVTSDDCATIQIWDCTDSPSGLLVREVSGHAALQGDK